MTRKQSELLKYIKNYIKENDYSPSFNEMKAAVNLKSKAVVHRLIEALEKHNKIKRVKFSHRSIEPIS